MELKRCLKNHYFDGDIHSECPVCAAEKKIDRRSVGAARQINKAMEVNDMGFEKKGETMGFDNIGFTEPVGETMGFDNVGFTEPVGETMGFDDIGFTEPVGETMGFDNQGFGTAGFHSVGKTEPVEEKRWTSQGRNAGGSFYTRGFDETKPPTRGFSGETVGIGSSYPGVDDYGDETMCVTPGKAVGFYPVVGWLVCVDGPDRGNDYRIRTGYNQIGRAEHMDICIRGDHQISREKHALIAYDDTEQIFFFGPSEGRNIVRINGKMVMVPTPLNAYDILTVGTSKLIFVPLCGEHFNWNN